MKKRELDKIKKKFNNREHFDINTLSRLSFNEFKECFGIKYNDDHIILTPGTVFCGWNKRRIPISVPLEDREREVINYYFGQCDPMILPTSRLGRPVHQIYFDFNPKGYQELVNFIILEML